MEDAERPVSELGLIQRIWGTFAAPRTVFAYLEYRPRILGVLLILVAVHVAASLLMRDIAFETQQRKLDTRTELTQEQKAQAQKMMDFWRPISPVVAAAWPVVVAYGMAGVLLAITNLLLKGGATYRRLTAAMAHIGLVSIPMFIVQVPLVLAKRDTDVRTSLAAFLPHTQHPGFLERLLSAFDVFFLWKLGLAVLAVSVLARVPPRRAAYAIVGAWLVALAVFVPLATLLPG